MAIEDATAADLERQIAEQRQFRDKSSLSSDLDDYDVMMPQAGPVPKRLPLETIATHTESAELARRPVIPSAPTGATTPGQER